MTTFRTYMLRKAYENVKKNGDRLAQADSLIEWEAFRPIIAPMYRNKTPRRARAESSMVRAKRSHGTGNS